MEIKAELIHSEKKQPFIEKSKWNSVLQCLAKNEVFLGGVRSRTLNRHSLCMVGLSPRLNRLQNGAFVLLVHIS